MTVASLLVTVDMLNTYNGIPSAFIHPWFLSQISLTKNYRTFVYADRFAGILSPGPNSRMR
jgi:hypothetical protein